MIAPSLRLDTLLRKGRSTLDALFDRLDNAGKCSGSNSGDGRHIPQCERPNGLAAEQS